MVDVGDDKKIGEVIIGCSVFVSLLYQPRKHRPFEALNAVLVLHPTASASCCRVIVTTVTTTTPSNAIAATIAITANDVVLLFFIPKLQNTGCFL